MIAIVAIPKEDRPDLKAPFGTTIQIDVEQKAQVVLVGPDYERPRIKSALLNQVIGESNMCMHGWDIDFVVLPRAVVRTVNVAVDCELRNDGNHDAPLSSSCQMATWIIANLALGELRRFNKHKQCSSRLFLILALVQVLLAS